jgi:hypothetical protein
MFTVTAVPGLPDPDERLRVTPCAKAEQDARRATTVRRSNALGPKERAPSFEIDLPGSSVKNVVLGQQARMYCYLLNAGTDRLPYSRELNN